MTKAQIKKQLAYERKKLEEAKDFMEKTEGCRGASCSGSESIGFHHGRACLLECLLEEKTK